jgi:hypothetical protein
LASRNNRTQSNHVLLPMIPAKGNDGRKNPVCRWARPRTKYATDSVRGQSVFRDSLKLSPEGERHGSDKKQERDRVIPFDVFTQIPPREDYEHT